MALGRFGPDGVYGYYSKDRRPGWPSCVEQMAYVKIHRDFSLGLQTIRMVIEAPRTAQEAFGTWKASLPGVPGQGERARPA
jgi:hypothetical protein